MQCKTSKTFNLTQIMEPSFHDQLIKDYAPLVNYIAKQVVKKLPTTIDLADLVSVGFIGLIDAIQKFDSTRKAQFKTYAEYRIRGAMYDELRALDHCPRSRRNLFKKIVKTQNQMEQILLRSIHFTEVLRLLDLDMTNDLYIETFVQLPFNDEIDIINQCQSEFDPLLNIEAIECNHQIKKRLIRCYLQKKWSYHCIISITCL